MAVKKFSGISSVTTEENVLSDYEQAQKFDSVSVGNLGAYFREGFSMKYMEYSLLERVFLRIQEINLRTCCSVSKGAYFKLVFVSGGREVATALSEDESAMKAALAAIHEKAPNLAIGKEEKEE